MTLLWRLFSEESPEPKTHFLVAKAGGPQGEWIPCHRSPEGLVLSRYAGGFVDTDKWTHWAYVTTPSSQLKPCPFCSGTEDLVAQDNYVTCDACGAQGPPTFGSDLDGAILRWNDRKEPRA